MFPLRIACISLLLSSAALAGINWKSVWIEPRMPVVLTVGEAKPFTVMGRNGMEVTSDLTRSPYLVISSSDPEILAIDRERGTFMGKKPGHAEIRVVFSDAGETVAAFVRPANGGARSNSVDGVWKAVFTGDRGEQPKMVPEIVFVLDGSGGALTGTVHAAAWPGDGAVTDGKIDGDRITFSMTGHLPSTANGAAGYPKLCFTGVRSGGEMAMELVWTQSGSACDVGRSLPMAGKRVHD